MGPSYDVLGPLGAPVSRRPIPDGLQGTLFHPPSDWSPPAALPDLRNVPLVALDCETHDRGLNSGRGSSWYRRDGFVTGISAAWQDGRGVEAFYAPLQHPGTECYHREAVGQWLRDHLAAGVKFVTQGGLYDWGWMWAGLGVDFPGGDQIEEVGAAATMVDENRLTYGLDDLCSWRGLPGKDESLLIEALAAHGLPTSPKARKQHMWRLPARYVGPYAEADARSTLALWLDLMEVVRAEGTMDAYRLEVDLLPMVLEMRRRGVRVDVEHAERERVALIAKRDAVFSELRERIGEPVGMEEIGRARWLERIFQAHAPDITIPRTATGLPSFTAGSTGWMPKSSHWLPKMIVRADKLNNAAQKFLQGYIIDHSYRGRIHAEVHPHRSDHGGTRSMRFAYSNPPLQQMTSRDDELAPIIRGSFLPEEDEVWAALDISQQEYRQIVHFAQRAGCAGADEAVRRYCSDPSTDFHNYVVEITGLERRSAKDTNFAKAFGAGVPKFADMINRSLEEAQQIYDTYDAKLPFVSQLAQKCEQAAQRRGYIRLLDGARSHFHDWEPRWISSEARAQGYARGLPMNPCPREEALRRTRDPGHPWHGARLRRAETRKAMNRLIQGSAARQTKLWMRLCWREGLVPLLQMHDELDFSVARREQAEMALELGRQAATLEVPVLFDAEYGRNWGAAKYTWELANGQGDVYD